MHAQNKAGVSIIMASKEILVTENILSFSPIPGSFPLKRRLPIDCSVLDVFGFPVDPSVK
jgi:hypothetical protein